MADINLIIQNAVPWILYLFAILGAFVCLIQKDLIKMAVLTSITGFIVALTQAVVGAAIVPTLVALTILKTREQPVSKEEGDS